MSEAAAEKTLGEKIFPSEEVRDGRILRLELVSSWESQLLGIGRLTRPLTERLMRQTHAPDDMGLNVIFLQRHRVEVGLKLIQERSGAALHETHSIPPLVAACARACRAAGLDAEWDAFERSQAEFMDLMDQVDPLAASFRFPVGKNAQPLSRRKYVDLEELEAAGASFEVAVISLIDALAAHEPLPIEQKEAETAAQELAELVQSARGIIEFQRNAMGQLRGQVDRLSLRRGRRPPSRNEDAYAAAEAVEEVTEALGVRAAKLLERIVTDTGIEPPTLPPLPPLGRLPELTPTFDPAALKRQQDAQIKAFVDGFVERVRPLTRAVEAVRVRSEDWATPAARQLQLDVARFQSRLMNAKLHPDDRKAGKS